MLCIGYVSFLLKFFQELAQSVRTVWIRIRLKFFSRSDLDPNSLHSISSMTELCKEFHMSMKVLCIGSHYMFKLCFTVRPSEYDQKIRFHRL